MRVVNLKHNQPYTVYIGRPRYGQPPNPLANQFSHLPKSLAKYQTITREESIERFREYARQTPIVLAAIERLKETDVLGCWCAPLACHGDVIIELWKEMKEDQMAKNKMKQLVASVDAVATINKETAVEATGKSSPIVFADLPLISKLPQPLMNRAKELLEELDSIKQINKMNEEREKELEGELEGIQKENGLMGLRWGSWCFAWRMMEGRKTLSVEKLVENGVSAAVIEKCRVKGKDFAKREFRNIND